MHSFVNLIGEPRDASRSPLRVPVLTAALRLCRLADRGIWIEFAPFKPRLMITCRTLSLCRM